MHFGTPSSFWLLALLPALVLFLVWAFRARRRALEKFAASLLAEKLAASVNRTARAWKAVWLTGIVLLATLALARPQWGFEWKDVKQRGVDVFVVLDVSKSMLAEDIRPSRLAQAKFAVEDLLKKLQGDRIGLIAFAGAVFVQCPLTVDHEAFRMTLREVAPEIIPRGGTAIGAALRTAVKSFEAGATGDRAIVLITDGEDTEGDPLPAAEEAAKQNVRVFAIGVGTSAGELIPLHERDKPTEFLKDKEGKFVTSRLNEDVLRQIALKTGGIYVRSAAGDFGMDAIYEKGIGQLKKSEHEARLQKRYFERYQWPLGVALALLIMELFVIDRKKIVVALVLCLGTTTSFAGKESNWPEIYNQGVTAYRSNEFARAAQSFEQATASPDRALQAKSYYNMGNAYYRQGESTEPQGPQAAIPVYEKSLKNFESALANTPTDEDTKFNRDLVKKKIEELKKKQAEQEKQQQQQQQKDDQKQQNDKQQQDKQQQDKQQQQQQDQSQSKPENQKQEQQQRQKDKEQKQQEQQQQQEQAGQMQTNRLDKAQAKALLDNLREQEQMWNFFPELQMKESQSTEPEKDW